MLGWNSLSMCRQTKGVQVIRGCDSPFVPPRTILATIKFNGHPMHFGRVKSIMLPFQFKFCGSQIRWGHSELKMATWVAATSMSAPPPPIISYTHWRGQWELSRQILRENQVQIWGTRARAGHGWSPWDSRAVLWNNSWYQKRRCHTSWGQEHKDKCNRKVRRMGESTRGGSDACGEGTV